METREVAVVIPAYNESHSYFSRLVLALEKEPFVKNVIVVNDGSTDNTYELLQKLKRKATKLTIVSYRKNKGKEYAVKRGLEFCINSCSFTDLIALMDSDGQHKVSDLERMYNLIKKKDCDVVSGVRNYEEMPLTRKVANVGMRLLWNVFGGLPFKDVLFGQKIFKTRYVRRLANDLEEKGNYKIELDLALSFYKQKASIQEIKVRAEYKDCSRKSGMGLKNTRWIKQTLHALKIILSKS